MGRATVADVAKLAGVSTATVSRVLTGSVPVSSALRERVQAAAERLEYSVNEVARALRRERTSIVGIVVPDLSNPFFTALAERVETGLRERGLSLHVCSSSSDVAVEASRVRSLRQSLVEVLIVTPVDLYRSGRALRAGDSPIPLIQLDQFAEGVDSDWVGTDEALGMHLILDHLVEQGVRTAAYIGAELSSSSAVWRHEAVRSGAVERGIKLHADPSLLGQFSLAWGVEAGHRLADAPLPDAVVCAADVIALGVLQAFDARGVRVPEDTLLTGFDDIPLSSHPRLDVTTVRQPLEHIATRIVELVDELRHDQPVRRTVHEAVRPDLVLRESSRRRR